MEATEKQGNVTEEVDQNHDEIQDITQKKEAKSTEKGESPLSRNKGAGSSQAKAKKRLAESQHALAEMQDRYLRLTAEFDNYRKRTLREKMELVKTGGEQVILNLLPIIDNLERAMVSIREAKDSEALKEGMELIYGKFQEFLTQNGVQEVDSMMADFDTDVHEAITKIPASDPELKGKVVDVIERGYYLHGKVVRFAKVIVGE